MSDENRNTKGIYDVLNMRADVIPISDELQDWGQLDEVTGKHLKLKWLQETK